MFYTGRARYGNGWYYGELYDKVRHGKGVFYFDDGDVFEGEFYNNFQHGYGILYRTTGEVLKANYVYGQLHGWAEYTASNGTQYKMYFEYDEQKETYRINNNPKKSINTPTKSLSGGIYTPSAYNPTSYGSTYSSNTSNLSDTSYNGGTSSLGANRASKRSVRADGTGGLILSIGSEFVTYDSFEKMTRVGNRSVLYHDYNGHLWRIGDEEVSYDYSGKKIAWIGSRQVQYDYVKDIISYVGSDRVSYLKIDSENQY